MSRLIDVLRAIVRDELQGLRLGDLAVVTAVTPRAAGGDNVNHCCDVRLRDGELELLAVPIATPHTGMVSAPMKGDLVLITYVNGDGNRPIITGRLYSDQARVPVHEAGEWHVETPLEGKTSITLDAEGSVVLVAGDTKLTMKKDGNVEIDSAAVLSIKVKSDTKLEGEGALKVKVSSGATIECSECTVNASGSITLGTGGGGVITNMTHKCYFTGAPLIGSMTVTAKG